MQKQRTERQRKRSSAQQSDQQQQLTSYYNQQAAAAAAAAAQQQQAAVAAVPTGGSYVYTGASGAGTVECDCGDDNCPNCNLLLQMSMGDQQW